MPLPRNEPAGNPHTQSETDTDVPLRTRPEEKGGEKLDSMDEIYQRYARTVYRYLLSLTRSEDLAEELTQETFCQAIRTIGRFDGSSKISTWLCGVAKNVLLTWRRKHPQHENIEEADPVSADSVEEDAIRSAERVELYRHLQSLPERSREVFYLRIGGGLSFREIGEVLGKTENWARVTFYRGKEQLRKEVANNETDTL